MGLLDGLWRKPGRQHNNPTGGDNTWINDTAARRDLYRDVPMHILGDGRVADNDRGIPWGEGDNRPAGDRRAERGTESALAGRVIHSGNWTRGDEQQSGADRVSRRR